MTNCNMTTLWQGSPRPTHTVIQKEEEVMVIQEQSAEEQGSPRPAQTVMEEEEGLTVMQEDEKATEEKEELVDTQKQPVDGQVSPRSTQIFVEQKEEESTSAQGSAGKRDKHTESPPISTERKILVDAYIQTEDPSVSDACMETTSF